MGSGEHGDRGIDNLLWSRLQCASTMRHSRDPTTSNAACRGPRQSRTVACDARVGQTPGYPHLLSRWIVAICSMKVVTELSKTLCNPLRRLTVWIRPGDGIGRIEAPLAGLTILR